MDPSCQGLQPRTERPACPRCRSSQCIYRVFLHPALPSLTGSMRLRFAPSVHMHSQCQEQAGSRSPAGTSAPIEINLHAYPHGGWGCVRPQVPVCPLELSLCQWDVPQATLPCSYPSTQPLATAFPPHAGLRVAVIQVPLAYTAFGNSQLP